MLWALITALTGVANACGGCCPPDQRREIEIDYMHDHTPAAWLPRLEGVDVVVNAVGILRESATASVSALAASRTSRWTAASSSRASWLVAYAA